LCKWKNYSFTDNSWESGDTLRDYYPKLLSEYEQNSKAVQAEIAKIGEKKLKVTTLRALGLYEQRRNINGEMELCRYGFDRGLTPEKIVETVQNPEGDHSFLIKWKECDEADIVASKEAHERCPQLVIEFYESRVFFEKV
jgi:hypothetical protein